MWPTSIVVALLAVAVMAASWRLKRWAGSWGATRAEVVRSWPGDELSPHASEVTTRAVTIDAPTDAVWAWLVQIGQDRAGFYSFRWLENLFRCAMPRVERIVPEWQQRTLGDIVWLARRDRYRGEARQKVVRLDPGSVLSLASPADSGRLIRRETSLGGTWTFVLAPLDAHRTRLIVRSRGPEAPSLAGTLFWMGLFAPAHFIMERKMMLRIKSLAETHPHSAIPLAS
ncbi:MAG: hypothetical protein M3Q85_09945 [Acidobacteriota bacterium]|nr:hypothetical protein [Acidobacteriota bacterium]